MTFMMFFTAPFKQLAGVNEQFSKLESPTNASTILFFKIIYVLGVLASVGVGVWKLSGMGLLPNTRSDWVAWEVPSKVRYNTITETRTLLIIRSWRDPSNKLNYHHLPPLVPGHRGLHNNIYLNGYPSLLLEQL